MLEIDGELVMMEPYVDPEHKILIDEAGELLRARETELLAEINRRVNGHGLSIDLRPSEIQKLERGFHCDPYRRLLIKKIGEMKLVFEKPRFMIKSEGE